MHKKKVLNSGLTSDWTMGICTLRPNNQTKTSGGVSDHRSVHSKSNDVPHSIIVLVRSSMTMTMTTALFCWVFQSMVFVCHSSVGHLVVFNCEHAVSRRGWWRCSIRRTCTGRRRSSRYSLIILHRPLLSRLTTRSMPPNRRSRSLIISVRLSVGSLWVILLSRSWDICT